MLHAYAGNTSLIGDAVKLRELDAFPKKALFVIGFEHEPARISLDPLLLAFESIAKHVIQISLGKRVEVRRTQLVHPEHQVLRCVGWELIPS